MLYIIILILASLKTEMEYFTLKSGHYMLKNIGFQHYIWKKVAPGEGVNTYLREALLLVS